jgi:hypothetical protein
VDNIDIVEADGDVGNHLEVCGGVQHTLVDPFGDHADDRPLADDAAAQLVVRHDGVSGIEIDIADRFELAED